VVPLSLAPSLFDPLTDVVSSGIVAIGVIQSLRALLPTSDVDGEGQIAHVFSNMAAEVVEYLPAPQSMQAALPTPVLYLPAPQSTHVPPSSPVQPALHVQSVCASLASGALEFGGHPWHTLDAAPTTVEY